MIPEMPDHDGNAPIIRHRLIQIVVPHHSIQARLAIGGDERLFERCVVADEFVQAVERALQHDVLAARQRALPEFIAFDDAVLLKVAERNERVLVLPCDWLDKGSYPFRSLAPMPVKPVEKVEDLLND